MNTQVALFPAGSIAWHVTSVTPISNLLPESTLHATVRFCLELSVTSGLVQFTTAVGWPKLVSRVWLVGHCTVGASVSANEDLISPGVSLSGVCSVGGLSHSNVSRS